MTAETENVFSRCRKVDIDGERWFGMEEEDEGCNRKWATADGRQTKIKIKSLIMQEK